MENDLNNILEEAFQNIMQHQGPSIFEHISNRIGDLSNNQINITTNTSSEDMSNNLTEDISQNTINTPILPSNQNQIQNAERAYELIDEFSLRWFNQVSAYQTNMRDYNKNMLQMNRISSNLLRAIVQDYTASPSLVGIAQPRVEIQGFSVPIPNPMAMMTSFNSETTPSFPTISQILNAVELFVYNDDNQIRVNETRCPISLEDFAIGDELCEIKHCRHVFKWTSLQSWFSRNNHCPVCRYDIRQEDS